jgi:hypothetical protein
MAVPLINGIMYSAASVNNIAFGVPAIGIVGINYTRKQVKEHQYNLGNEPIGRTYGQIMYEASITVYKDWWNSVIDAAPNRDPLQIGPFNWTIAYGNLALGQALRTETLQMFEFLEDGLKVAAGDTKLTIDIACIYAGIERL